VLSCHLGVEIEVSPYIHPPFKIATSQSNGLGMKNVVKLHASDMSRSSRVFAMELRCEFWCGDFGSRLPGIVFAAVSLLLNEVLESSPIPMTVEYFLYFPLRFSINDYRQWVVLRFVSCNQVIWSWSSSTVVVSFHVVLCLADRRLCFFDCHSHPFCKLVDCL